MTVVCAFYPYHMLWFFIKKIDRRSVNNIFRIDKKSWHFFMPNLHSICATKVSIKKVELIYSKQLLFVIYTLIRLSIYCSTCLHIFYTPCENLSAIFFRTNSALKHADLTVPAHNCTNMHLIFLQTHKLHESLTI